MSEELPVAIQLVVIPPWCVTKLTFKKPPDGCFGLATFKSEQPAESGCIEYVQQTLVSMNLDADDQRSWRVQLPAKVEDLLKTVSRRQRVHNLPQMTIEIPAEYLQIKQTPE